MPPPSTPKNIGNSPTPNGGDASSIGNTPTQDASPPEGIGNPPTPDTLSPKGVGKLPGSTHLASASQAHAPVYFNPLAPIIITQGDLPHWEQQWCSYFVTFRLADSLPADKLKQWKQDKDHWLKRNPPPHDEATKEAYQHEFGDKIQMWLMQGHGSCLLKHPASAKQLSGAMLHFHQRRYRLHRASIMENHVHVLVTPLPDYKLRDILHSWKSYTANKINAHHQRKGTLWQKESFDTIIRSADHLKRVQRYMDENAASPACVLDLIPEQTLPAPI